MKKFSIIAAMAFGLEAVCKRELVALGFSDARISDNKIYFTGGWDAICKANLWLRTADRILIELASFKALSFEELFQGVKKIPWEDLIPYDGNFLVDGSSVKSQLFSISDSQAVTEKAIVERLKTEYPDTDRFPKTGARYKIKVSLLEDIATITLDTTGESLHKRGYRKNQAEAPIKETLAAGLVLLSYYRPEKEFFDPFCGSGTILIEAAMIGKNIAPGLDRHFDFEEWDIFDKKILFSEKTAARKKSYPMRELSIFGSDSDPKLVKIARDNIKALGLEDDIRILKKDFRDVKLVDDYGVLVTNPPYGKRIYELNEVVEIEKALGEKMSKLPKWSWYVITSDLELEKNVKRQADRRRKFYNGNVLTYYYQFYGEKPPKKE